MSGVREQQELGSFRLLHRIGSGGMGEVWLAQDARRLRTVAVRILPDRIASDASARTRLVREVRAAMELDHPSIAAISSLEDEFGCLLIAMEHVEGKPLRAVLGEGVLSDYDIVRTGRDIAEALAEAHEHAIAHRAIRAGNVIVAGHRVKVLDFGIAGLRNDAPLSHDLFSLGALVYEALSGQSPFTAVPFGQRRPDLPNELAAIIDRSLRNGFGSARDLATALERVLPRLSRIALPATPTIAIAPKQSDVAEPPNGKRVLIADDDPAMRRLFETLSRRAGVECDSAANGPEAIAALKERDYEVLFLDIMMPRIDGWGVLDYLRSHPAQARPAIFIVTSITGQTLSVADREIVQGIIYKPFDTNEVAALIRDAARAAPALRGDRLMRQAAG